MSYILLLDLAQSVLTHLYCLKNSNIQAQKVTTPDMKLVVVITYCIIMP